MQRLRAELQTDLTAFQQRIQELRPVEPVDGPSCAVVAVALHHAYGAVESAFLRLSRVLDATEPAGREWHQELLTAMAMDVPEIRPALIGADTRDDLQQLLAFRHFFRHAYAVKLDPGRLAAVRAIAQDVAPLVERDFENMDRLLADLASDA